jgi:hypothetical protein
MSFGFKIEATCLGSCSLGASLACSDGRDMGASLGCIACCGAWQLIIGLFVS